MPRGAWPRVFVHLQPPAARRRAADTQRANEHSAMPGEQDFHPIARQVELQKQRFGIWVYSAPRVK